MAIYPAYNIQSQQVTRHHDGIVRNPIGFGDDDAVDLARRVRIHHHVAVRAGADFTGMVGITGLSRLCLSEPTKKSHHWCTLRQNGDDCYSIRHKNGRQSRPSPVQMWWLSSGEQRRHSFLVGVTESGWSAWRWLVSRWRWAAMGVDRCSGDGIGFFWGKWVR
jgi:hypothetical protein